MDLETVEPGLDRKVKQGHVDEDSKVHIGKYPTAAIFFVVAVAFYNNTVSAISYTAGQKFVDTRRMFPVILKAF